MSNKSEKQIETQYDISTYVKEFGENYEMMEEQAEYLLSEEWEADLNDKANYISIRDDIIANVRILSNINNLLTNSAPKSIQVDQMTKTIQNLEKKYESSLRIIDHYSKLLDDRNRRTSSISSEQTIRSSLTEEQLSRVLDPDEKYFKSISEKLTYEISNSVCNLAEIPELIIQESGEENYLELPTNNSTPRIQELIQDKEQLENKNQALELKILELNQKLEKQADDLTKKLTAQMDVVNKESEMFKRKAIQLTKCLSQEIESTLVLKNRNKVLEKKIHRFEIERKKYDLEKAKTERRRKLQQKIVGSAFSNLKMNNITKERMNKMVVQMKSAMKIYYEDKINTKVTELTDIINLQRTSPQEISFEKWMKNAEDLLAISTNRGKKVSLYHEDKLVVGGINLIENDAYTMSMIRTPTQTEAKPIYSPYLSEKKQSPRYGSLVNAPRNLNSSMKNLRNSTYSLKKSLNNSLKE